MSSYWVAMRTLQVKGGRRRARGFLRWDAVRPTGAGLTLLLYLAAAIGLPGLHLWSHVEDHDHHGGGIHFHSRYSSHTRLDTSADHPHPQPKTDRHTEVVPHRDAQPGVDRGPCQLQACELSYPTPLDKGHAAGSLAHFATSYLYSSIEVAAPLSLPIDTPSDLPRQRDIHVPTLIGPPLGARAPPLRSLDQQPT